MVTDSGGTQPRKPGFAGLGLGRVATLRVVREVVPEVVRGVVRAVVLVWGRLLGRFGGRFRGRRGPHANAPTLLGAGEHLELPEWARHLETVGRLNHFERIVESELRGRGLSGVFADGVVRLTADGPADGDGRGRDSRSTAIGLANLSQVCAGDSEETWAAHVRRHFGVNSQGRREFDQALELGYADARRLLRIRLWDHSITQDSPATTVTQQDLPGLDSMLVLDLPSSIANVSREMLTRWSVPAEQAFARALDNVVGEVTLEFKDIAIPAGGALRVAFAESYYAASLVLAFDRFPELNGPFGSLVSVPVRHMFLVYPIRNREVLRAIEAMIAVTHGAHRDGPGSISNRVMWYRDRRWREIPIAVENGRVSVIPPQEFVDALHEMEDGPDGLEDHGEHGGHGEPGGPGRPGGYPAA